MLVTLILFTASEKSRNLGNRSRRAPLARNTHSHDNDWNFTGNRGE